MASFIQSPTKSAMVKLKRLVRYLVGFSQAEWAYIRQVMPKYLDVYGDSDWAGDEERKRSTTGVAEIFGGHLVDAVSADTITGRAVQRGGGVLCLQPRHRGWTANVSLPDRGGIRGDSASVERQQRLPRDRPQYRHRQAQALGDPTHVGTGATAERRVLAEGCSDE